jgi:N-acetylglucosaminyldiphosphoundecaprenol N-acetyl-beta-D-mannosaminyltransferase
MARHITELHPAVAIGVGAAFDFHARTKQRAPNWMQTAGLEWLHRLGSEPKRLGPRYLRTNASFLAQVATNQLLRSPMNRWASSR